jgi:hypothetical protein
MPDRRDLILQAVAGKGAERGLVPERQEDGTMLLRYPDPQDERQDNLHKQSIRALVGRMAPDWRIHITSNGEDGFLVEVRPKPGSIQMPAAPESHGPVEPGPTMTDREIDLTDLDRIERLAQEMIEAVKRVREIG